MAKHRSLDTLKMSEVPLLWEGTRILSSRLMDVQSRMNWVSSDGEGWLRILERGWTLAVVFISSGRILSRVPDRALHTAIIWVTDSISAPHRVQEGLSPDWSLAALSAVKKSPDRNFRWARSFLTSCVEKMFWSAGWLLPDNPSSSTLRNVILLFVDAWTLSCFSVWLIILVFTRHVHLSFDHTGSF